MVAAGGGPYQKGGRRSWRLPPLYQGWELQLKTPYIKGSGSHLGNPSSIWRMATAARGFPPYEGWQLQLAPPLPYKKGDSFSWRLSKPYKRPHYKMGGSCSWIPPYKIRGVAAAAGNPFIRRVATAFGHIYIKLMTAVSYWMLKKAFMNPLEFKICL